MLCFQSRAGGTTLRAKWGVACAVSVLAVVCTARPSEAFSPSFAWHCLGIN